MIEALLAALACLGLELEKGGGRGKTVVKAPRNCVDQKGVRRNGTF